MPIHIERISHERARMSNATRVLLCDFAAGDLEQPPHDIDADWHEVFQAVCRNGLLGLTHRYLARWDSREVPPTVFREWVHEAYRVDAMRMALNCRHIRQVLVRLTESGIGCMVIKGPAVAYMVYPQPTLRPFNDLDIVVREEDWGAVHNLLVTMGFCQQENLPQPPPKVVPQAVVYELKYWHPDTGLLVEPHFEDLLNAGLASRDVEGFWSRSIPADLLGVPVRVMSLEDQLIHLSSHAHFGGYGRLVHLSDIAFIVRDHAAELNWDQVLDAVRIEEAQVAVYYTLYFVRQLLSVDVPDTVLDALRPDRFRRWWHERYLPEEQVLSLQPMSRPHFSFYHRPLLKRLLPDLLVMGRRGDKLRYLLRLLVPPKAWLRYYYGLDGDAHLALHYLLHPLKLAYHYLAELGGMVR